MSKAIQLHFDSKTEKIVRNIWQMLKENKISSKMTDRPFTPHITLFAAQDFDDKLIIKKLSNFFRSQNSLKILLATLGTFNNNKGVLFFGAVNNQQLIKLHSLLFKKVSTYLNQANEFYFPDRWIPHCTLANEVTIDEISKSILLLKDCKLPIKCTLNRDAIVQYPECKILYELPIE
jgi:hypothetical protein